MWLSDLRLVLPDGIIERGALRIAEGHIADIIEGPAPGPALSVPGLMAIPGIIDLHGDMLERDIEPRPRAYFPIDWALYELDKRLAAAGITTAYAAISFAWRQEDLRSQEKAVEIIETVHARRAELLVDMRVHTRFEVTNPATAPILADLLERGLVDLISIMDHTPGQGQYGDVDRYVDFITRWLGFKPEHLEADLLAQVKTAISGKAASGRDWDIIAEVAQLGREYGIPLASHDDDTAAKVLRQAEMGITISEFPVSLEAAQTARDQGLHVIMGAPNAYRGGSNTGNLSALDAIKAGLVDILATDYVPAAPLHAAFRIADEGILPLHESLKMISQYPAEAMSLHDRGRLEVGARADIVLVGKSVHHRVHGTIRGGTPIYWDSTMASLTQAQAIPFVQE
jgi:alpha-D-ribose 1-methylphosphonate 5-triphosphate diphosphatase